MAPAEPLSVAYDFTAVLSPTDSLQAAAWTSHDAGLVPTPGTASGFVAKATFANTLPEGHSALVSLQITSTAGQIESRAFRVVAIYR